MIRYCIKCVACHGCNHLCIERIKSATYMVSKGKQTYYTKNTADVKLQLVSMNY